MTKVETHMEHGASTMKRLEKHIEAEEEEQKKTAKELNDLKIVQAANTAEQKTTREFTQATLDEIKRLIRENGKDKDKD